MTQEEKQVFEEDLKKFKKSFIYFVGIGLILFLFFSIKSCNDRQYQQLEGKYDILKSQYQSERLKTLNLEQSNQKVKDSLSKQIAIREAENIKLSSDYNKLEESIQEIKSKKIVVPKDTQGLVKYFNDRYKTNENQLIENKVGLTQNTAYDVSYELEEKDNIEKISFTQGKQLSIQGFRINLLSKDKDAINMKLSLTEKENESRKGLLKLADENIETLESQVKTLNRKNTFNKILIPASLLGGGFLGYQIAK